MSSTRSFKSPGIFASAANTVIPPTPIAGQSYRNAATGADNVDDGWPYAIKVNSAEYNEILYRYTSILNMVDHQGVPGWTNLIDYTVPAITFGSDGKLYLCTSPNGPATTVRDPVASPAYWKLFDSSSFLSNTVGVAVNDSAGVQRFLFSAGDKTSVYGAAGAGLSGFDVVVNGATVLQAKAGGVVSFGADAVAAGDAPRFGQVQDRASVGFGQTWQDLTATRALATNYTNSTSRPITVSFWALATVNGQAAQIDVNGVTIATGAGPQAAGPTGVTAVIPPGATYSAPGVNLVLTKWFELR